MIRTEKRCHGRARISAAVIEEMAKLLAEAVREIDKALSHLGSDDDAATEAADAAIKAERKLERAYYNGMGALLDVSHFPHMSTQRSLTHWLLQLHWQCRA